LSTVDCKSMDWSINSDAEEKKCTQCGSSKAYLQCTLRSNVRLCQKCYKRSRLENSSHSAYEFFSLKRRRSRDQKLNERSSAEMSTIKRDIEHMRALESLRRQLWTQNPTHRRLSKPQLMTITGVKGAPIFDLDDQSTLMILQQKDTHCAICLEPWNCADTKRDSKVLVLSCTHTFHKDCLLQWLKVQQTCPVCRKPLELETTKTPTPSSSSPQEEKKKERKTESSSRSKEVANKSGRSANTSTSYLRCSTDCSSSEESSSDEDEEEHCVRNNMPLLLKRIPRRRQ